MMNGLDNEQKNAVILESNGIISAGAGSGKTRVLASRFSWLITEKGYKPDEILALTFTNKAVSEMYSRIYSYLLLQAESGNTNAANALRDFYKARISTLDSFSANIARTSCARYGISPDFKSDDMALRRLAKEAALRFILDNREQPAIRQLLVDHKIKALAENLFAETVLRYSLISSPLDFEKFLDTQKKLIIDVWHKETRLMDNIVSSIIQELHDLQNSKKSISLTNSLSEILLNKTLPTVPDITSFLEGKAESLHIKTRQNIKEYFDFYVSLVELRSPGRYGDDYSGIVENFRIIKGKKQDGLFHELESIANYALNFIFCSGVFELLEKFQNEFNAKKRSTGLLTFNDIAHLAVDALKDHPDIRRVYKDGLRMIMIDEFQDNNALQRDLVYLLAENRERMEKDIPSALELENMRMFFAGDEKQSIYRFRGADVSVFRTLNIDDGQNMDSSGRLQLIHNYRSRPTLISAYNYIFSKVFFSDDSKADTAIPDYEAVYTPILAPKDSSEQDKDAPLHFCFLNAPELLSDDGISSQDLEAAFIAGKIKAMKDNKEKIPERTDKGLEWRPCDWGDFAILQRSYTHQSKLEKYLRDFGIPYNTDRPTGLFNEAPIPDLLAYLKLLVNPGDRIAYAALIRSPFMRLSDLSLAVCMLNKKGEPFAEENEEFIPKEERELYCLARERFNALQEASRKLPITELITKLWFEEGYRLETLWSESSQVYESLFDLFYSLASDAEARGLSLAEFIEYMDEIMNREEKPDDKDIPGEGGTGVKIMSIHKAKGLEFPIVFIFNCTNAGNKGHFFGHINYHEKFGLILNIPQADELPAPVSKGMTFGRNYFRKLMEEEERAKDIAELKRLLYVAMTRAESRLFLTFTLPRQTKEEKKTWDMEGVKFNEEVIRNRLSQLEEKTEARDTFLKLLLPVLPDFPADLCTMEAIPVLTRKEISRLSGSKSHLHLSQKQAALAAAAYYENAELIPEGKALPSSLDASSLRWKTKVSGNADAPLGDIADGILSSVQDLGLANLSPTDFGTLVHAVLEARLKAQSCIIPQKIRSIVDNEKKLDKLLAMAEDMAASFIDSELGKRWFDSENHESEFHFITSVTVNGKPIAITGRIDLVFEESNEVVVIDFKTDRIENPQDHYGQLAVYFQAAKDIFKKPVSAWLFYLRSGLQSTGQQSGDQQYAGRAINVTKEVQDISLEHMAAELLFEM